MKNSKKRISAFTIIELVVIIGVLAVLTLIAVPSFRYFQKRSDLKNSTEEIINILRLAQNRTLASEEASQYGVYFDQSSVPPQYILFKGTSFISRDISYDRAYKLPLSVEWNEVNLSGGNEVVFERINGMAVQPGAVSLRLKTDSAKIKTIYIEGSGRIGTTEPSSIPDGSRVTDSRHVHVNYTRNIDTFSESLVLTSSTSVLELPIMDYMEDDQIYWEGEIDVGGETQKIKLHTHRLNSPDTQLSIHRDRRFNTAPLKVEISGDSTGTICEYSSDGLTTTSSSIYASTPIWQ